jgi:LmbE family N-acetylglucosaminyl deacetylase
MRQAMPDLEHHELITPLDRALVIFSHPDDAEFSAAATIALLTFAMLLTGLDYVVTTDAEGDGGPRGDSAQLTATREAEQRAAADRLGVSEIVHLGYPDGYLTPSLDLRRDIVRQVRRFRPDLVIAQNPIRRQDGNPFVGHPDHLATGEATLAAVYPAARDRLNFPELIDEGVTGWLCRPSRRW